MTASYHVAELLTGSNPKEPSLLSQPETLPLPALGF